VMKDQTVIRILVLMNIIRHSNDKHPAVFKTAGKIRKENGMKQIQKLLTPFLAIIMLLFITVPAGSAIYSQCPEDIDGVDRDGDGDPANDIVCMHITGGDGFADMADGTELYVFSFGDVTGVADANVIQAGTLGAETPAPRITVREGQELYLTLSNTGMIMRPDLFDPHSVHWHGFPNAAPIFDGLPEPSPTPVMGASLSYYYNAAVPGTYFYHCHVEAAEHMQMGMIGNLWVYPKQNLLLDGTDLNGFTHNTGNTYAYNDGDGSTYYDVEYPVQLTAFDRAFHEASLAVAPLPFADMYDDYGMINGRGYPDTIVVGDLPAPASNGGKIVQKESSLISATQGDKILLRVSNVSTTHIYALTTTLGVPMKVVGRGAALLRGPNGDDTSYSVNVLNVAGGQAYDVIVDTAGVPAGTYYLYTTNLASLSNGPEERGGIMTEIIVAAAP